MSRVREENLKCMGRACESIDNSVNQILSASSVIRRALDTLQKGIEAELQLGETEPERVGVIDPLEAPEVMLHDEEIE